MPDTSREEVMEARLEAPASDVTSGTNATLKGKFRADLTKPKMQASDS